MPPHKQNATQKSAARTAFALLSGGSIAKLCGPYQHFSTNQPQVLEQIPL